LADVIDLGRNNGVSTFSKKGRTCGFVFNAAFDPNSLKYSPAYDTTRSCSPYFKRHLTKPAESLLAKYHLSHKADGIMEDLIDVPGGKAEWTRDNPRAAVHESVASHLEFEIDLGPARSGVTYWPDDCLRRK
jgi:hypothetical protein